MISEDRSFSRRAALAGTLATVAMQGAVPKAAQAARRRPNPTGLRGLGIVYDTGIFSAGRSVRSTHEPFDAKVVKRDMKAIADDLHCTAVRIVGGDPGRIDTAARLAAHQGLEVWVSPFTVDLTQAEQIELLGDCAVRAERLRRDGADAVFVAGAEISLFTKGFLPGETIFDRLAFITTPGPDFIEAIRALPGKINAFFAQAVPSVRRRFLGPVTYAAIDSLERVDWAPFDMITNDTYRDAQSAATFPDQIRAFVARGTALGKPAVITESGCVSYDGGSDLGGRGDTIVEYDNAANTALRLTQTVTRDEAEQAQTIEELVKTYDQTGVHTAFVQTFAMRHLPYREHAEPTQDLDRASFGIVRPLEHGHGWRGHTWEPKEAYFRLGALYQRLRRS
ncbi:hypothetical protein GCM10022224_078500 [Nonomuraea antimicrobica]|uniref:Abortive infection protein n=1 Tax=Nonomuraea antimicrobica TaxID=561173 RepID=A0ABP7D5H0_9ACTN